MFLPTKEHKKEMIPGQFKLRKGNRVPKDAVNLAYLNMRPVTSSENVKITDLSNTILENQINNTEVSKLMFPTNSLLLQDENYKSEMPTSDILLTNVFKDDVPLYYVHRLEHKIYDRGGADNFTMLDKTGIVIVDKNGNDVDKKYRMQLIPDQNHSNLYHVHIFTEFNDIEAEDYEVVYNAVVTKADGSIMTIPSHREKLVLSKAYERTGDVQNVLDESFKAEKDLIYYQTHAAQPYHSNVYVPTPEFRDTRLYEKFRYQIGVEVETENGKFIFSTPWYSDHVIHYESLSKQESAEYLNGYKKITKKKTSDIMKGFVPYTYFENTSNALFKYFVNIDNPYVKDSTRIDGSSEVYVQSIRPDPAGVIEMPEVMRIVKRPVETSSHVEFYARPLKAPSTDLAYISVLMDNSESMAFNDSDKIIRYKSLESIIYAANKFYENSRMNIAYFANLGKKIQDDFTKTDISLVNVYQDNVPLDNDVTRPDKGIDYLTKFLYPLPAIENINGRKYDVKKFMIIVTDGDFEKMKEFNDKLHELKQKNVAVAVVVFNNVADIKALCDVYDFICLDGSSQGLAMRLQYLFFTFAGIYDKVKVASNHYFTTSPTLNDNKILIIEKSLFTFPAKILAAPHNYGIELRLNDMPYNPDLTIYVKDSVANSIQPTMNESYIIEITEVLNDVIYDLYVVSNAFNYYISHVYSVRYNDKTKIKLLPPREQNVKEPWYPRIQNGRFDREQRQLPAKPFYVYSVPEYYRQDFIDKYPLKRQHREVATIMNETTIRLNCLPIVVDPINPDTKMDVYINGAITSVADWNAFNGLVTINGILSENDEVIVDYAYKEESYVYKGYYDEANKIFWRLDLNPSIGHYTTILDEADGVVKDVPSFYLINHIVYFYIKPAAKYEVDSHGNPLPISALNKYTVYHTFEKQTNTDHLLIGEVRVRPNSNKQNIKLYDSRTRGGGLEESITLEQMRQTEEESIYYWDIGYWDGQPFPENGITVVRITRSVLSDYGGRFTKTQVEEKVCKHLGYGILPIIEYLDDPDVLIARPDGLTLEIVDIPEIGEITIMKPTFETEVR